MTEKVKFGIIGVGNMGSGHLRFFMNGQRKNVPEIMFVMGVRKI